MADVARIEGRLDSIEQKLDRVLAMLSPVHSHAEWVDGLHGPGLVRSVPRIAELTFCSCAHTRALCPIDRMATTV
jgi:hypothetical protein